MPDKSHTINGLPIPITVGPRHPSNRPTYKIIEDSEPMTMKEIKVVQELDKRLRDYLKNSQGFYARVTIKP